jgi:hypothetical protein
VLRYANGVLTRLFQTVRPAGASKWLTGEPGRHPGPSTGDLLNGAEEKEVWLGETVSPTPPAEREDELREGCRAADPDAFERLYEMHAPRMKSIAWNLLGNAGDARSATAAAT